MTLGVCIVKLLSNQYEVFYQCIALKGTVA